MNNITEYTGDKNYYFLSTNDSSELEDGLSQSNGTARPDVFQDHPYITVILISLYFLIWIVGVFGNVMVLHVVHRYKVMRTTTNIFIACLSVSDLAICFFAIPLTPANALMPTWIFGKVLCKLGPFVPSTAVFVSTLISVVIAIDRFVVIIYPHRQRISTKLQTIVIVAVTVFSALVSLPVAISITVHVNAKGNRQCTEQRAEQTLFNQIYNWFILFTQLMAPALIITFCYTAISIRLHRRANIRSTTRLEHKIKAEAKKNKNINRMLITMVTIFIICWLPLDLFLLVIVQFIPERHQVLVFLIVHVIAMSSVIYNPFLYGWMNESFNKYFHLSLPCLGKWSRQRSNRSTPGGSLSRDETFQKKSFTTASYINVECATPLLENGGSALVHTDTSGEILPPTRSLDYKTTSDPATDTVEPQLANGTNCSNPCS